MPAPVRSALPLSKEKRSTFLPEAQFTPGVPCFKQAGGSLPYGCFNELQTFRRKIIPGMPLQFAGQQATQPLPMSWPHTEPGYGEKIAVAGRPLSIREIEKSLSAFLFSGRGKIEQRISMIKQRRGAFQGIGRRVHEKTKIPEMPIRIADDGIKDEHVFQHGLAGRIERSVIVDDRLHAAACHNLTDRHKRDSLAGEQLASGAKAAISIC